jgi:nicotinamidase-related amidase
MIMPTITLRRRRVIVDVDTQRHFFLTRGIVCVQNHRRVLANIRRVVDWAQLKNIPMISTVQIYSGNHRYCNSRFADTDGQKKISYTLRKRFTSFDANDCTDLPPQLLDQYDQVILHKRCFDPFEEPRADRMLSEVHADEFIVIGAVMEGAVKATALGLLARQKNVTVLIDAIGSYDRIAGETTLRQIWERGAKLTTTKTLLRYSCFELADPYDHNGHRAQITRGPLFGNKIWGS